MLEQYEYWELEDKETRNELNGFNMVSIGEDTTTYDYEEHFRILTLKGATTIRAELEYTAECIGVTYEELMETLPVLKELIK